MLVCSLIEVKIMNFWISVLKVLDTQMTTPTLYGPFHIFWLAATVVCALVLCRRARQDSHRQVCNLVLGITLLVAALEIYKQINYSFTYSDGSITFEYLWYAFPFQFCSTPMYIGLLAGIFRKGKLHDHLCAYLTTYAVFAGVCVMLYPAQVFCPTVGINIQTMIWHGSMIVVGAYLLASGHVKLEGKTVLKAIPVFAITVAMAAVMNEAAYRTGLLEEHNFNMFYISPYCPPSLPVYSLVQQVLPFPWSLTVYVAAFTLAAYLVLLGAMGIRKVCHRLAKAAYSPAQLRLMYK